jgi:hypothetical protein
MVTFDALGIVAISLNKDGAIRTLENGNVVRGTGTFVQVMDGIAVNREIFASGSSFFSVSRCSRRIRFDRGRFRLYGCGLACLLLGRVSHIHNCPGNFALKRRIIVYRKDLELR